MTDISLIVYVKPAGSFEWKKHRKYQLYASVIQIGRAKKCQINLMMGDNLVSRIHATLFKYEENEDYTIQDGQPGESTIADPDPPSIPSALGTLVNGVYLTYQIVATKEVIESRIAKDLKQPVIAIKQLLKDRDEILIVPEMIKLVYSRPTKTLIEDLDQTVIPDEYRQ